MKLGKYFTMKELTRTDSGYVNIPDCRQREALKDLVREVLDPARERLGKPIIVNSGFRSPRVNAWAGGVKNSQHAKGEAADIESGDNAKLFFIIRMWLDFDQLIWEGGNSVEPAWIHVSYRKGRNRKEVLRMVRVNGKTTYQRLQ